MYLLPSLLEQFEVDQDPTARRLLHELANGLRTFLHILTQSEVLCRDLGLEFQET